MGRPSYVCATCSEHFTRKSSGKRHNQNLHNGAAEIVRLIDYLAGRSSGQYTPNNPFWYKRNNPYDKIGGTIPDSVGNTFQPRYLPQQVPLGSQYSASPIHRPLPSVHDQSFPDGLSQETIRKMDELKRLVYKYREYQNNDPDEIVRWTINGAINGDNRFLDEKLKQLLTIDSLAKFYVGPS